MVDVKAQAVDDAAADDVVGEEEEARGGDTDSVPVGPLAWE